MRPDDARYGAHSAIQKAVRRGDLDLGKTSFDLMWPAKPHRNWLKWRLTSIIQEDVWPLIGELPDFFSAARDLTGAAEEEHWRKMVYRMIIAPANKDAGALSNLARRTEPEENEHPELALTRKWFALMKERGDDPGKVADDLFESLLAEYPVTDYQKAALRILVKRTQMGGMLGDRQLSLPAMILVVLRKLDPEAVREGVKKGAADWAQQSGRRNPVTVPLPWYSFDMHTQVGKIALSSYSRRSKIDRDQLFNLWFLAESAFIPRWHCQFSRIVDHPTVFDSMWWPVAFKERLGPSLNGSTAKQNLQWWREELREDVKGLIEWLLTKRESED
jgi:hypothetical protein